MKRVYVFRCTLQPVPNFLLPPRFSHCDQYSLLIGPRGHVTKCSALIGWRVDHVTGWSVLIGWRVARGGFCLVTIRDRKGVVYRVSETVDL